MIGHRERVAARKLGNPEGLKWVSLEFIEPDATLMTGAIVRRHHTKGPRKGEPVYSKPYCRVVVTQAEEAAERKRWENETGKCGECLGEGRVWYGWSKEAGHRYKPCPKCSVREG